MQSLRKDFIAAFPISLLGIIILLCFTTIADLSAQNNNRTAKPWTNWWWMGNAVNKQEITRQMQLMQQSGIGGVNIIPIYGVKGYEDQFLPLLSEPWMEMIQHAMQEAERLNMGVDMTMGSGWPFGGPMVNPEHGAKKITLSAQNDSTTLGCLDNNCDFIIENTGQLVKRAAPGGEGLVLDYFSRKATDHYINHFDSVFRHSAFKIKPRAFYLDSYEVYHANWTNELIPHFQRLRGYDLQNHIALLLDSTNTQRPRFMCDIRETISDLLLTEFAVPLFDWAKQYQGGIRYQAHGSPSNLLDLYALSDLPETESFGCSVFNIPGLECDPDYEEERFSRPHPLMMKFASSPAHLLGKPLVSSETATWLGNHFKVNLAQVKPQIDELFTAGINHITYHGMTYSPEEEGFPGWLFYASTNFGPTADFWDELPELNRYITNCQQTLQQNQADNDILLYFPIHDIWTKDKGDILLPFEIHHFERWFGDSAFGEIAQWLWDHGYSFDYISDLQLNKLETNQGQVYLNPELPYKVIVIPLIDYIKKSTLERLDELADQGVNIIVSEKLPGAFSGLSDNQLPDAVLSQLNQSLQSHANVKVSNDLIKDLAETGVRKEMLKEAGLEFYRMKNEYGPTYFVSNLSDTFHEGEIQFNAIYESIIVSDPLISKVSVFNTKDKINISIPPGKSLFFIPVAQKTNNQNYELLKEQRRIQIPGPWRVDFISGNNDEITNGFTVNNLTSWTSWGNPALQSFLGKASYKSTFQLSKKDISTHQFRLDFEDIRETAAIYINNEYVGTIWSFPKSIEIHPSYLKKKNTLEIIVQNGAANRIRELDKNQVPWKKFYDINFVDIQYKPFDASQWSLMPSGLIGKVELVFSNTVSEDKK